MKQDPDTRTIVQAATMRPRWRTCCYTASVPVAPYARFRVRRSCRAYRTTRHQGENS